MVPVEECSGCCFYDWIFRDAVSLSGKCRIDLVEVADGVHMRDRITEKIYQ